MTHSPHSALPLRAHAAALLDEARRRDPLGHQIHLALALVYLALLPLTTAPKDIALAALGLCALLRLRHTWGACRLLLRDTAGWLLLAWTAWTALSIAWSPDPAQGLDELRAFRFVITPALLWPVIEHVAWLVGAFLAGVAMQNGVQLGQALHLLGLEPGANDRLTGLLHPIHTGTVCAMATCWHAALLLRERGRRLLMLAAAGFVAAGAGLLFAGSRGPWIAAAAALPVLLIVTALRWPNARRRCAIAVLAMFAVAAVAWPLAGDFVTARAAQARADLGAVQQGMYASDVGLRVASWISAWRMFGDDPLAGIGAGGFQDGAARTDLARYLGESQHAHSTPLHVLATTGVVGGGLLAALVIVLLIRAWRDPPDHPFAGAGTLCAAVAYFVAATFDAYHLAGQMAGVLAMLVGFTIPWRAPPRRPRFAIPSRADGRPNRRP